MKLHYYAFTLFLLPIAGAFAMEAPLPPKTVDAKASPKPSGLRKYINERSCVLRLVALYFDQRDKKEAALERKLADDVFAARKKKSRMSSLKSF